jgi:hypothetical protein
MGKFPSNVRSAPGLAGRFGRQANIHGIPFARSDTRRQRLDAREARDILRGRGVCRIPAMRKLSAALILSVNSTTNDEADSSLLRSMQLAEVQLKAG